MQVITPKNKPSKVIYRPEKNVNLNNHRYSIANARKDLGYQPKYSYKDMLMDMKREMQGARFDFLKKKEKTL